MNATAEHPMTNYKHRAEVIMGDRLVMSWADELEAVANDLRVRAALVDIARLFKTVVEYEIRRDSDDEGRRMKTITLNLIAETLALAGAA